jgi:hypothetical protein
MNAPSMKHPLLASALVLLAACGGGGDSATPPTPTSPERLAASKPGEVLAQVKTVLRKQRTAGGATAGLAGAPAGLAVADANGSARSNTTTQEIGVDEEDLIKTTNTHLYTLYPQRIPQAAAGAQPVASLGRLQVHERGANHSVRDVATLDLPYPQGQANGSAALHHAESAQRLAVLGQGWLSSGSGAFAAPTGLTIAPYYFDPRVELRMVSVATPAQPVVTQSLSIDGQLIASRRIGNVLYVLMNHRPKLRAELTSADAAVQEAALAQLSLGDLLPQIRVDGGAAQALVAETDCYSQTDNASPVVQISTVTAIDLSTLARASRCFLGGSEALYMSPRNLYVATSRYLWGDGPTVGGWPAEAQTDIHQFSLAGLTVNYRASGSVSGHLGWNPEQRPFRLSEQGDTLRVLTFTGPIGWLAAGDAGSKTPSPATLTVLEDNSGRLQTVSTLPNAQRPEPLGKPGEQVYGVRFAGDRAYLVTFRVIDPLYVLDLANPADPRTVGVLEVPGFSDYLYPLPNGLLLGVGRDADAQGLPQGVKLGLFDVRNPAAPAEITSKVYGSRFSHSALSYARQGLNLFERSNGQVRAALPLVLTNDQGQAVQQGLLRMTIDTAARSWQDAPLLAASPPASGMPHEPWFDRATQIDETVYYLSNGQLQSAAW